MNNQHPLLGWLRLAWEARHRYTLSVEQERHNRYGHVSRLDQARGDELEAARAYLAALPPACSVCGCTSPGQTVACLVADPPGMARLCEPTIRR